MVHSYCIIAMCITTTVVWKCQRCGRRLRDAYGGFEACATYDSRGFCPQGPREVERDDTSGFCDSHQPKPPKKLKKKNK